MPQPGKIRYLKLAAPVAILALAVVYFFRVDAQFSFSGKPSMDMLLLMGILNFVLYLWLRILSGWQFKTQIVAVFWAVALQATLLASVQMEGILGNGRPLFAWRWAPRPADQFVASSDSNSNTMERPTTATWPQFRGENRDGIAAEEISNWKNDPPELMWKQSIGAGWSSFAVAGRYGFTLEQRGDEECLVCYRIEDGKQMWINSRVERFSENTGGEGPRSTPTFDNGFLYSLGATGMLQCVDAANGDTMWDTDALQFNSGANCLFGMCGSPLVTDGKVIVSPGGKGSSLVAFDKHNGDLVWRSGDADASYSSPVLGKLCGIDQVLNFNGDGLDSHDLETGAVLWHIDWVSNEDEKNNVCQPIRLSDDEVFLSSAYGMGCARIRIRREQDRWRTSFVWQNKNLKSKFSSAVFDGRNIFGLDLGILVCLDPVTGKRVWKNGRYAHGQFIKAGDYLVVQSEKGFVAQAVASAAGFEETGRVTGLRHRTWTHPVIADGVLLIRNDREMAAYRLKQSD